MPVFIVGTVRRGISLALIWMARWKKILSEPLSRSIRMEILLPLEGEALLPMAAIGATPAVAAFTNGMARHWNQLGDNLGPFDNLRGRASIVSLSDDGFTVAVGNAHAHGDDLGRTGIYRWDGSSWNQLGGDIEGEHSTNFAGRAVSLSGDGDVVAIGASLNGDAGTYSGHARVFGWDGAAWNQIGGDLDGEERYDESGVAVSLSGDATTLVIGGWGNDATGNNAGHARIYRYDGTDWQQSGSDIDGGAAGDQFGSFVAISGDSRTVAIGATEAETTKKGYTRVYRSDTAPWLGLTRDSESDGTPSASADGDGADEDGIVFNNFYAGSTASIDVTVSGNNGLLDGWFDFNADGDWEDAGEQVFASTSGGRRSE